MTGRRLAFGRSSLVSLRGALIGTGTVVLLLLLLSERPGAAAEMSLHLIPEQDRTPDHYALRVALDCHHAAQPASVQWTLEFSSAAVTIAQVAMSHGSRDAAKNAVCQNTAGQSTCLLFGVNQTLVACGDLATIRLQAPPNTSEPLKVKLTGAVAASPEGAVRRVKADSHAVTLTH